MKLIATKHDNRGRLVGTIEVDIIVNFDHQVDFDPYTRSFVRTSFADFEYDLPFPPYSFDEEENEIVFFVLSDEGGYNSYSIPYPPDLKWYDEVKTKGGWDGENLVLKAQRGEYLT